MELKYNGVSLDQPAAVGEISFKQRMWLAKTVYGLYAMLLPAIVDDDGLRSKEAIQIELIDICRTMDNLRVPRLESQLSIDDRNALEEYAGIKRSIEKSQRNAFLGGKLAMKYSKLWGTHVLAEPPQPIQDLSPWNKLAENVKHTKLLPAVINTHPHGSHPLKHMDTLTLDPKKLEAWIEWACTDETPQVPKTLSTIKPDDTLEMLEGGTAGIITIDYGKTKPCLMDADEFGNLSGLPAGRSNNNDDSI